VIIIAVSPMSEHMQLSYHPDSPYYGKEGYLGHLTPSQSEDLAEIEGWMIDESLDMSDLCLNYLSPKLVILRYLRANKFCTAKVKEHILRNIEWRAEMNVKEIVTMHPSEILGCDIEEIMALFPHWQSKFDKHGRPILYKHYSATFDATRIKDMSSMDALAKYHIWEQEACMRLCYEKSLETGHIIETVSGIVDVGGLQLSQLSRDLLAVIKIVAEIDQSQYPETMGQTFVVNTSSVFPVVWRMVKPWLDPVVAGKIHLLGRPEEWTPLLDEYIDLQNVSVTYGGVQAALSITTPPYFAITGDVTGREEVTEDDEVNGREGTIARRMNFERHLRRLSTAQEPSGVLEVDIADDVSLLSTDGGSVYSSQSLKHEDDRLVYHPNSPYATQSGFLGSLSPEQSKALEVLQKWVIDERIDVKELNMHALHPKLTLLRYLRANKYCTTKAIDHMRRNLEWRAVMDIRGLCEKRPFEILGCDMSDLVEVFPHWQSGFDKFGRPVMYKQYNNSFEASKILQMTTADKIAKYHIWEQEACMRLCNEQSRKTGHLVETVTAVVDVKGMQLYQVTRDFLAIIKSIAEIDQNQYPETLGQTFIINTPSVFPLVWRGVKPWLDPVVASKIQILGQNEEEWTEALSEYIGLSNMPSTYHGELAELNSDFHPYQSILGPLPGGSDGNGLSIADRIRLQSQSGNKASSGLDRALSRLTSRVSMVSASESSVGTSAFADALDGGSADEFGDWGAELDFIRSMVHDVESGGSVDVFPSDLDHMSLDPENHPRSSTWSSSTWARKCIPPRMLSALERVGRSMTDGLGWLVPAVLVRQRQESLRRWLTVTLAGYMILCLTCIGLTGYALSTMYWTDTTLVRVQMWSGVVVIAMSTLLALLNFAGFVGGWTSNRPLLALYSAALTFYFILFFVVGMVCFVFSTGNSHLTGLSHQALGKVSSEGGNVEKVLRHYNIILGTVATALSLFSLIPLILSTALAEVIKRHQISKSGSGSRRHVVDRMTREQMGQFRVVVRIAQAVSMTIALAMVGYGASALNFLLKIRLDYFVFSVYCLLYAGVTIVLSSAVGIWSSYSTDPLVVRFYSSFVIPLVTVIVICTATYSCALLPTVPNVVTEEYDSLRIDHESYSEDKLETVVQIHLLVSCVLSFSGALFQLFCLSSVHGLYVKLSKWRSYCKQRTVMLHNKMALAMGGASLAEMNKMDQWAYDEDFVVGTSSALYTDKGKEVTLTERLIVMWSILLGLFHIYLNGTYAMFAYRIVDQGSSSSWFISLWREMGKYDSRYTTADDFLVSVNGIMAVVVGPLMLVSSMLNELSHPVLSCAVLC
jgi:hypothetical protein